MALETGLVSYWNMNEETGTRADLLDNNPAPESGPAISSVQAIYGHGGDFTGGAGEAFRIDQPTFDRLDSDTFSISLWIKPKTLSGPVKSMLALTHGLGNGWWLVYRNTGQIEIFSNDGSFNAVTVNNALTTAAFTNVVMTRVNGGLVKIYSNGVNQIVTGDPNSGTTDWVNDLASNDDFLIGMRGDTAGPTDSIIDSVGYWEKELTQAEVTSLYNNGLGLDLDEFTLTFRGANTLEDSLLSYWPLDEPLNDRLDIVGLANLNPLKEYVAESTQVSGIVASTPAVINDGALLASGAAPRKWNLRINQADFTGLLADTFSVSFWMKKFDNIASVPIATTRGFADGWWIENAANQSISFTGRVTNSNKWNINSTTSHLATSGSFHHIVATRVDPSGVARLYLNGILVASVDDSGDTDFITKGSLDFVIGMRGDAALAMSGVMDEIGFWTKSLAYEEVIRLYNGGLGLNFDGVTFGGPGFVRTRLEYDQVRNALEYDDNVTMGVAATAESGINLQSDFNHVITQEREIIFGAGSSGIGNWYDLVPQGLTGLSQSYVNQVTTISGDLTANISDTIILADATSAGLQITLPDANTNIGKVYHIKKIDSTGNSVTVSGLFPDTIDDALTQVISVQYDSMMIVSDDTNWHIV